MHDDRTLFEFIRVRRRPELGHDSQQARKLPQSLRQFRSLSASRGATADRRKTQQLLRDPGIVRNKLKVASAVGNAKAFRGAKRIRQFRPLHFAIRRWQAASECPQVFLAIVQAMNA